MMPRIGIISPEIREKWSALGYDNLSLPRTEPFLKKILKYKPESVLDVGCGSGSDLALLHLLKPGIKTAGLDLNREQIDLAAERIGSLATGQDFFVGGFHDLDKKDSFASESFDVVISHAALLYSSMPLQILEEMYRVAKKAVILLEIPTLGLSKALENYKVVRKRVSSEDIDVMWRNFGFIFEIKK